MSEFLYGIANAFATPFERSFDCRPVVDFVGKHPTVPFIIVAVYLLFCYYGSIFMKSRKALELDSLLALWNASLSIFSFMGAVRTVPYLLARLSTKTFFESICGAPHDTFFSGPTGLWVALMLFSKIPELFDTVFIVLRKKPLIFLHWYHHVTVLLFCWNAYVTTAGSGLYFVAMNFTVHGIMYGYYCLKAVNLCPKSFPASLITLIQILQMFIGTAVCISAWYFKLNGEECHNDISNLTAGALMYASYFYLFVDFALRRERGGQGRKPHSTKELVKELAKDK